MEESKWHSAAGLNFLQCGGTDPFDGGPLRLDTQMEFAGVKLKNDRDAAAFFAPMLAREINEKLLVAHLNARHQVIAITEGCSQSYHEIGLPVRAIIADALAHLGHSLVMGHNHPSGDPTPSDSDIVSTCTLHRILTPLKIKLHDHLVITPGGEHRSFRKLGLL